MLSERLRELLNSRDIPIVSFAEMCDLPIETVRNIYYGRTTDPKISTMMKMSSALNLSVDCLMEKCPHSKEERAIIHYYRNCGEHGKSLILLTAKYEALAAKAERESEDKHKIPCLVTNGNILGGITYETCEVEEIYTTVPKAYVGVKISTNDLVPMYCKGDILLLENRFPMNGEFAVFYVNEKAYIRKFVEEKDEYRLRCIHDVFDDIVLKRMDEVEYVGTCIGVVRV